MKKTILVILFMFNILLIIAQNDNNYSKLANYNANTKVEAPFIFYEQDKILKKSNTKIQINYIGSVTSEFTQAVSHACKIWESLLNTNTTIKINFKFINLEEQGALGSCAATVVTHDNYTWPVSLANHKFSNAYSNKTDMDIEINKKVTWYYGTDGNTPQNKVDLVTTLMHEIAHGLGYYSNIKANTTTKTAELTLPATKYDYLLTTGASNLVEDSKTLTPDRFYDKVTDWSTVSFSGYNATYFVQNPRDVKIYAPTPYVAGSSITHLDEDKFKAGNSNSLMTPYTAMQEAIHSPGEIGLGILADLGWSINRLATFYYPNTGLTFEKTRTINFKWSDNNTGIISIELQKKQSNNQYQSIMVLSSSFNSQFGNTNIFSWVIPSDLELGVYRIILKKSDGDLYGGSNAFTVIDKVIRYVNLTAENNWSGGKIIVNNSEVNSPYNFQLIEGENLKLEAKENQLDDQGYNRIWHTGTTNTSQWQKLNKDNVPQNIGGIKENRIFDAPSPQMTDNNHKYRAGLRKQCNLTISSNRGGGTIKINNVNYSFGSIANIVEQNIATIEAPQQYTHLGVSFQFQKWSDNNSTNRTRTLTVNAHTNLSAVYKGTPIWESRSMGSPSQLNQNIQLTWNEHPNSGVTGYEIWRIAGRNNPPAQLIGSVGRGTTSYTDTEYVVSNSSNAVPLQYDIRAVYTPDNTITMTHFQTINFGVIAADTREDQDGLKMEMKEIKTEMMNYPDPFNPSTTIKYSIAEAGKVNIRVYDITGKEIKVLVDEYKERGEYSIQFNAGNLSSGIYLYRMIAPNYVNTKKMLLVK